MPAPPDAIPASNNLGLGADQLLDTLPWGVLEVSAAGSIRRLNRQAAAWWGVSAEATLGQTIEQAGPGQLPAPAYAALAHAASGPTAATECYLPATEQWMTLSSAAQPTGELVVHWQDSTAAHQRAQQYQALAENTPDVLTRWSLDLRLLYANAAFAAQAGQPLPALLGRAFADMGLPAEVTGPYQAVLQRVFDTGQPQEHYNTFPGPHGPIHYHSRLVPELRDGQLETVLGIARDISELKRTEAQTLCLREALRQQATDRYQALFHATEQGFCVLEILFDDTGEQAVDFRYLELNPVFAEQSGMPADAQGKTVRELLPDLEPFWFDTYGQVARTGEPVRVEHPVPPVGRWFDVHAFRVGASEAHQVAVLFNDITARKQAEATLRRAAEADAFRLQLADALGPLTDAVAIQEAVTHRARLHFAADRCYYCELVGGQAIIRRDAAAAGLPSVAGSYPLADFALLQAVIAAGQPFSVPDVRHDETVDENLRQLCVQLQVISYLNVPVFKNEAAVGVLCLVQGTPRQWTTADVDLAAEVAERTWVAVERARAEAALTTSEAKYRTLFESIDEGFCVFELQFDDQGSAVDWVYQEANPAFEGQTGYVNAVGKRISDLQPNLERSWFERFAEVARTGEPTRFVQVTEAMNRWYDVYAFRVGAAGENRVSLLFTDISERKRREANTAFLNEVSQDLAHLTTIDATLNALGEKIAAHLGLSACLYAELLEAAQIAVIAHGWQRAGMPNLLRTYRTTEFMNDEIRQLCLSGQPVIIRDVFADPRTEGPQYATLNIGSFVGMPLVRAGEWRFLLVVYRPDPSDWREDEIELIRELMTRIWTRLEQARAEAALRDSEARLHMALDAADLGTFVWHVAEDRTEEDARARVHFGLAPNSTVSLAEALVTTFHPDDAPRYAAAVAQAIDPAGSGTLHEEFRVRHPNGQQRWLAVNATTTFAGPPRTAVRLTGVLADITERQQQEQYQEFLLKLSDTLRAETGVAAVGNRAVQLIAEQLGVDRVYLVTLSSDDDTVLVTHETRRADLPPLQGAYRSSDFPAAIKEIFEHTIVYHDVRTDARLTELDRLSFAGLSAVGFIASSIRRGSEAMIWAAGAVSTQPRGWTASEVTLFEDAVERTWAAVERARAEQALRESEAQLYSFVTASSDTLYRMSADWQQMYSLQGRDFLAPTEAPSDTWLARYIPEADQPTVQTAIQAAIASRHFFELEHRVFRAGGSIGWTFSRAVPVLGAQNELVEWFGTATDITARKQAEEALRRSEERLRLALDAAELGTWDWNLITNEVRWNARHFTMLGLAPRPDPLTPDDFAQAVHPADRPAVLERLQAAVAGNHLFEAEFRILTPQDDVRWMSGHGQPTEVDPDGHVWRMSGVLLDVTERKHAEQYLHALAASLERKVAQRTQALQESKELLQSVYDTTLIGLAVLHAVRDEATGSITDFSFLSANQELARQSGRPDLARQRYGQQFPGQEASSVLTLMAQTVETGQPRQSEFSYSIAGVRHWVAFMCVKLDDGVVATMLDITERKHAEQERTRNLHLLEQAETVAQLGSWDYDLASGQFYWSGGMYDLFGLPLGQPVQPPIYLDYVLAEDRLRAEQLVQRITTGVGDFEETLRLRVGEAIKTVRLKAVVLRDAAGQPVRVLGVDLDISELQRLEADNLRLRLRQQQALFEAVQAAEEAERRRISESLHNGIGQLLYATKLQLDRLPDAPELSPRRQAAELLGEAIRQTRALSHELTPAILEEFGLEKTLQSICSNLNTPGLRWQCHLAFEETPPLPLSLQLAVYRLAQELAQNVLKHAQATEATLEVDVLPAWVVLRVEDNGQGFDPAQTSDGLGLRSLRSRAALLGGSVHLTTAPDQGTQCQIRIPLPHSPL